MKMAPTILQVVTNSENYKIQYNSCYIKCFIDSITTANSIDYEKCKIFQPLRNLFEGGKKGTKCTYLVVVVLELPSLHYLDISPLKTTIFTLFIWSFSYSKKVTMA